MKHSVTAGETYMSDEPCSGSVWVPQSHFSTMTRISRCDLHYTVNQRELRNKAWLPDDRFIITVAAGQWLSPALPCQHYDSLRI